MARKSIAEHNAEIEAFSNQLFPADPGKSIRIFACKANSDAWISVPSELAGIAIARPGFLNYDGKLEVIVDRTTNPPIDVVLRRRDMRDAEFAALPTV